jgi:hypothetical protein
VDEFAVNFAADAINDENLKVLIVAQTFVAKVLCNLFAMLDRFGVSCKFDADAVSVGNAISHVEEELLHMCHPWFVLTANHLFLEPRPRRHSPARRANEAWLRPDVGGQK